MRSRCAATEAVISSGIARRSPTKFKADDVSNSQRGLPCLAKSVKTAGTTYSVPSVSQGCEVSRSSFTDPLLSSNNHPPALTSKLAGGWGAPGLAQWVD